MRIHIHPEDVEAARHGIRRSSAWPRIAKMHLSLQPKCVCCEGELAAAGGRQVHHVFPFHYCIALGRPDLELDLRDLITLCESEEGQPGENHHLLVGHLGSFQSSNLNVQSDAAHAFRGMRSDDIRQSQKWLSEVQERLKPLGEMTEVEKRAFAHLMNLKLPKRG